MMITVSHSEGTYNRATRKTDYREVVDGQVVLPSAVATALRKYAPKYRSNVAAMVNLALAYYFGDGRNHLQCEHCEFWGDGCQMPEPGEQITLPVLDKGRVVVGLPTPELGE